MKRNFAICENFVKTMSFIAATINGSKELVEFSALIAEYFKFIMSYKHDFSNFTLTYV